MTSPNTSEELIIAYLHGRELETAELQQICQQQFTMSYQEITAAPYFGTVTFKQLLVAISPSSLLLKMQILLRRENSTV